MGRRSRNTTSSRILGTTVMVRNPHSLRFHLLLTRSTDSLSHHAHPQHIRLSGNLAQTAATKCWPNCAHFSDLQTAATKFWPNYNTRPCLKTGAHGHHHSTLGSYQLPPRRSRTFKGLFSHSYSGSHSQMLLGTLRYPTHVWVGTNIECRALAFVIWYSCNCCNEVPVNLQDFHAQDS